MNEDIIVLDDFLPTYIQDGLEELCYNIDWELNKSSYFSEGKKSEKKYVDAEQFVYMFWDTRNKEPILNNPLISYDKYINLGHYFSLPLQISSIRNNIFFNLKNNFNRGKVNLTFNQNNLIPLTKPPHRDMKGDINYLKNNTWAIIYYVNESDGDTVIYNEVEEFKDLSKYTIRKKISPKKGRMVFIKGHLFHSASIPSNKYSKRIVINYNLIF